MAAKTRKAVIKARDLKGTAHRSTEKVITTVVPDERELKVFEAIQSGSTPVEAMKKAGYRLPDGSAERLAGQIHAKFNDRMKTAYEGIGLTPEFMASIQLDVMMNGAKDADRLKAVDQVLQVTGGYAPKQLEVNNVTFEQAVIEIGQIVNVHQLKASDVKALLAEDAQLVEEVVQ